MNNSALTPLSQDEFNQYINLLGPWGENLAETAPVAIAVSGGADSLCLAMLAAKWRRNVVALIVDHKLRENSDKEAILTQQRLSSLSISSKILTLTNLKSGVALEERARIARYDILIHACVEMGCVDLLLGHHSGDQAETVLMRIRAGSKPDGLAAMAQIIELPLIRLVRPLLYVNPKRLRLTLEQVGMQWVEDPSNNDLTIHRNQLRKELSYTDKQSGSVSLLLQRSLEEGMCRMQRDQIQADYFALYCDIRPEGFAYLPKDEIDERGLASLIRTISGSVYSPLYKSLERLARHLHATTLGGVQIINAGKLGKGWIMIREEAAMSPPIKAEYHAIWDHRFKVKIPQGQWKKNIMIGALGQYYKDFVTRQGLPVVILKTLPAFFRGDKLLAIPHLNICLDEELHNWDIVFQPQQAATQSYLFSDFIK